MKNTIYSIAITALFTACKQNVNDEVKTAKKEVGSSLSQTLFNYGVTSEALAKTEIKIKDESGFMFLLLNILPFLLPIVFILPNWVAK